MMRKEEIDENITRYIFSAKKCSNPTATHQIMGKAFEKIRLGTYGGMNSDVFYETLLKKNIPVQREEICPEDDDSIGLRMPNFWPVNQSEWALSIAMYYTFYQIKHLSIMEDLSSWNPEVRRNFGWISAIEVYNTSDLVHRLETEQMDYFTTSLTLMECVRFLEGWGIKRLEAYEDYSNQIHKWARTQDFYNPLEWNLGREKSESFYKDNGRVSNVRLCVQEFWKRVLLKKGYNPLDKEIDIVSAGFSEHRNPELVLLGEDFMDLSRGYLEFDENGGEINIEKMRADESSVVFPYNRYKGKVRVYPTKQDDPENHALSTAFLAREHHPNAKILMLSYEPEERKLFRLVKSDEVKEGVSSEVIFAAQAILDAKNEKGYISMLDGYMD